MKTIKLSLIAAMAASSISVASAQNLSDKTIKTLENLAQTIENINVSGTAVYRYNDYQNSDAQDYYKIAASVDSQVNDEITFQSRIIVGDKTNPASFNTSSDADSNVEITLSEMNFVYSGIEDTPITLGKQAIDTPFTVQRSSIGDEQLGTGLTAKTKLANTTFGLGYFNTTNLVDSGHRKSDFTGKEAANFTYVSAKTSVSAIKVDASYAKVSDIFDMYTVGLSTGTTVSDLKLSAFTRYSALDYDNSNDTNSLIKAGVKVSSGIYGAFLAYGKTDKEGGKVGLDDGANTGFDEHWRVTLSGINDASTIYASVNAQVSPQVNLALKYSDLSAGDASSDVDQNEIYLQVAHKMSSNLKSYIRLGQYDKDGSETQNMGRLNITYSF